jgi:PKD repeat protein
MLHAPYAGESARRRSLEILTLSAVISTLALACSPTGVEAPDESGSGAPVASFGQDRTDGPPGLVVQFTDTSSGQVTSHQWDFGAAGSSSAQNPSVAFPDVGTYSVRLTVSGSEGTSSVQKDQLIGVHPPIVADFTCDESIGFAPLVVTCTDESENASTWFWDFGDGTTSTDRNPTHVYTSDVDSVIQLVASGPGDSATHSTPIKVGVLEIVPDPMTGPAPLEVALTADTKGIPANLFAWSFDGLDLFGGATVTHTFKKNETYRIAVVAGRLSPPLQATAQIDLVVGYGPASADFFPSSAGGAGPLGVQLIDDSTGAVEKWEWDFGDGTSCVFPPPPPAAVGEPDPPAACDSSSPMHVYQAVGSYGVTLTVTGPGPGAGSNPVTSTISKPDQVRVYIVDPSFELQTIGGPISGGWEPLRPAAPTEDAEHVALSSAQGADTGFPSEGQKWAVLDGLGTDGSTPVAVVENGIRQEFIYPPGRPVLEFDYALLYSEPPAGPSTDATLANVSDGSTTVWIPSSWANVSTPYAGVSRRFPTRDSSTVRATPLRTASINLAAVFPASTDLTRFTLTIRTGNGQNDRRSPRTYVDNVRFAEPVAALPVDFSLETDPVVAGEAATFMDESCPDPTTGCLEPSSWRWDFGTHGAVSPPPATGSAAQDPTYVFAEPGTYEVTLEARLADAEGSTTRMVDVLQGPSASFEIVTVGPYVAPADVEFRDLSTSDPGDAIASWIWDFGGWGSSTLQNPSAVRFPQAGEFLVTLTITTASGLSSSADMLVVVE